MRYGICPSSAVAGMAALQLFYNVSTGLWDTTQWWNSANALGTTIEASRLTDRIAYQTNIFQTFEKQKASNFLNPWFYDDEGWWALTWIKAYDTTGERRYLDMAKTIFKDMTQGWDSTCGGGVWWHKRRQYKNAITNELFLSVAAKLHLRTPNDSGSDSYLNWAKRGWTWFKNSGLLNQQNLVNDGLDDHCKNNGKTLWTYNHGVILDGLVDLYKSTNDESLLIQAQAIADAAIATLAPNGILRESCEPADCGDDGPQFKGIFIRNLYSLYQVTNKQAYRKFILKNGDSIWLKNRNSDNQLGLSWAGPFDRADAARQSSAMDAINAALAVNIQKTTYQAENSTRHSLNVGTSNSGYFGNGYITDWNQNDQWVMFKVNVPCPGNYQLTLRYSAADGDASRYIFVGTSIVSNQIFQNRWLERLENHIHQ